MPLDDCPANKQLPPESATLMPAAAEPDKRQLPPESTTLMPVAAESEGAVTSSSELIVAWVGAVTLLWVRTLAKTARPRERAAARARMRRVVFMFI